MIDFELNCQGMNCPMPIVELTKATRRLAGGQRIEVTATDRAFRPDLEAWSRRMGHSIESFEEGEIQRAVICLADRGRAGQSKTSEAEEAGNE